MLRRVDTVSGQTDWTLDLPRPAAANWFHAPFPPVAAGGCLFVATCQNKVLRVDPRTGRVLQTYDVGEPVSSEPVVSDGYVWVGTRTGKVVGVSAGDARFTGWHQVGGNPGRTGTPAGFVDSFQPQQQPVGRIGKLLAEVRRQQRPTIMAVGRLSKNAPSKVDDAVRALFGDSTGGASGPSDVLDDPQIRPLVESFQVVDVSLQDVLALLWVLDRERLDRFYVKRPRFVVFSGDGEVLSLVFSSDRSTVRRVLTRAVQSEGLAAPPPADTSTVRTARDVLSEPVDDERRASGLLRIAHNLMERNPQAAVQRLERIVDEYPESQAAATAKRLLDPLRERGN
jgi:hypothetical protein